MSGLENVDNRGCFYGFKGNIPLLLRNLTSASLIFDDSLLAGDIGSSLIDISSSTLTNVAFPASTETWLSSYHKTNTNLKLWKVTTHVFYLIYF